MSEFSHSLARVKAGRILTRHEMRSAMDALLEGAVAEDDIAEFLLALKTRGERVEEIVAAAESMRARAIHVEAPPGAIDTCGTGGDGANTFNISTAAALIVAGCGAPVAKHGNRSASSRSGSSDILEALGVNLNASPAVIGRCIRDANIGFMFAAFHHRAVAHVAAVRKRLGVRTIFNLLGPLANPASARRQLMGVYDRALTGALAEALGALGADHAWVVHGSDGLDELTTTGPSFIAETRDGALRQRIVTPEEVGLARARPEDLRGGDARDNALALQGLLRGESGPYRDIAILNSAAALVVACLAENLVEGARLAGASIDEGRAQKALDRLVAISNEDSREHS